MIHLFTFKKFPMPPSANKLYTEAHHFNPKMRGRVKSRALKEYEAQVKIWMYRNVPALELARMALAGLKAGEALHIDRMFYFEPSAILTKTGKPKRNDTSNRIKALDDALTQLLWIDDCFFWSGSENKVPSNENHVEISFSIIPIKFA